MKRKRISGIPIAGGMAMLAGMLLWTAGCGDTPESRAKQRGKELWFEEHVHDYGEIAEGSDGSWSFEFKNIGETPVVINRVRSTCGCTVAAWPKEPIQPGERGEISVEYNTSRTGSFMKSVFVYSTAANSPVKLQIKGKVTPSE